MDKISVYIEVEANPTEDIEKVRRSVENIFGDVGLTVKSKEHGSVLVGKAEGLEGLRKLQDLLRREQIRDATRRALLQGSDTESLTFYLNKQVAYVSHISFSKQEGESTLGPIKVQISCSNPRELIDWLAPKTRKR